MISRNPSMLLAAICLPLVISSARASVEISTKATSNMSCSGGVCTPTAKKAVLNVGDLANMLAGGDVTVNTGGALAQDIEIDAALTWTSTHLLTLDSYRSIIFKEPVTVAGVGGLSIKTSNGSDSGDFYFFKKGRVEFWDTRSVLAINGPHYLLFDSFKSFRNFVKGGGGYAYYMAQARNWNLSKKVFDKSPVNQEGFQRHP